MPNATKTKGHRPVANDAVWRLEQAKAQFSEVVRRARADGPQHVSVRGQEAVVVVSAKDWKALMPPEAPQQSLVEFLQSVAFQPIDLERERDLGRDIDL